MSWSGNQNLEYSKLKNWYGKAEPKTQIEILKEIALNGFQTAPMIINKFGKSVTTIHTMLGKLKNRNPALIQFVKTRQSEKNKVLQNLYSLTEDGIRILVSGHYENNQEPYLSEEEFKIFLEKYEKDYLKQSKDKVEKSWKKPNFKQRDLKQLYVKSNPQIFEKYEQMPKIQKRLEEISNLEKDVTDKLFDIHVSETKNAKKRKNRLRALLNEDRQNTEMVHKYMSILKD
ncbi:MAG: hypothetical protein GWN40_01510 [Nitrosopumilaceae archaeon]|nr:hypothetical protein [Nitrosopumilaceae archaeon]